MLESDIRGAAGRLLGADRTNQADILSTKTGKARLGNSKFGRTLLVTGGEDSCVCPPPSFGFLTIGLGITAQSRKKASQRKGIGRLMVELHINPVF